MSDLLGRCARKVKVMFSKLLVLLRLKKKPALVWSGPLLAPLPGWRRAEVVKFGAAPVAVKVSEPPNV